MKTMEVNTGQSQFMSSSHAILKILQVVVVVTGMVLFLVGNRCADIGSYVVLFLLPCVVCAALTLVSLVTALILEAGRRNPLITTTWVKGVSVFRRYLSLLKLEVWFNMFAFLLMLVGSLATISDRGCSDTSITVAGLAMGFIAAILFIVSAALASLRLVRFRRQLQEEWREAQSIDRITVNSIT